MTYQEIKYEKKTQTEALLKIPEVTTKKQTKWEHCEFCKKRKSRKQMYDETMCLKCRKAERGYYEKQQPRSVVHETTPV